MDWRDTPHELRRELRVRSKGSITLRHGHESISGRVVDLSIRGICIRTRHATDETLLGERVRIDVALDGADGRRFALSGRILRRDHEGHTLAIRFDFVPAEVEDRVQDELLAAIEHDQLPHMILVDASDARRARYARAFRAAGCSVVEVATPLDAIRQLDDARFEPDMIAIADSIHEADADNLRAYLASAHPDAHIVAIGHGTTRPRHTTSWLSTTDARGDLTTRVGRVMTAHDSCRRSTTSHPYYPRHVRAEPLPLRPRHRTTSSS